MKGDYAITRLSIQFNDVVAKPTKVEGRINLMLIFLSKVEHKMRISDEWCVFNYKDDVEYSSILVATLQIYRLLNSKDSTNSEFGIYIL